MNYYLAKAKKCEKVSDYCVHESMVRMSSGDLEGKKKYNNASKNYWKKKEGYEEASRKHYDEMQSLLQPNTASDTG
jgi:hypothetical protein